MTPKEYKEDIQDSTLAGLENARGKEGEKKWTNKNKQGRENYKESTGTKLITNTKKQKLKI